jgi:hypothetical protein
MYNCCFIFAVDRTVSSIIELAFDDNESERLSNGETVSLPKVLGGASLKE